MQLELPSGEFINLYHTMYIYIYTVYGTISHDNNGTFTRWSFDLVQEQGITSNTALGLSEYIKQLNLNLDYTHEYGHKT